MLQIKYFFLALESDEAQLRPGFGEEIYEKLEFQEKVKKAYTELIDIDDNNNNNNNNKWIFVDANREIETINDEIYNKTKIIIEQFSKKSIEKLWV